MSVVRTTPVSTTIWRSPLMSISRAPSSTRSPFGSTSTTLAVIIAVRSLDRDVVPPPLNCVSLAVFTRLVGSIQSGRALSSPNRLLTEAEPALFFDSAESAVPDRDDALDDPDRDEVVDAHARGSSARPDHPPDRRRAVVRRPPVRRCAPMRGSARRARRSCRCPAPASPTVRRADVRHRRGQHRPRHHGMLRCHECTSTSPRPDHSPAQHRPLDGFTMRISSPVRPSCAAMASTVISTRPSATGSATVSPLRTAGGAASRRAEQRRRPAPGRARRARARGHRRSGARRGPPSQPLLDALAPRPRGITTVPRAIGVRDLVERRRARE